MAILEFSGSETPLTDNQTVRDTDELCVGELNARAYISVVQQHLKTLGPELPIQCFSGLFDRIGNWFK